VGRLRPKWWHGCGGTRSRDQYITAAIQRDIATRVGGLIWQVN